MSAPTMAAGATVKRTDETANATRGVTRRVQALDALRGAAILAMVLSGVVPARYPAWMHHAQCPPPTLQFNGRIPGITWVDLVFPFFLFSMGAAIPLAMSRRIEQGEPWWRLAWGVIQRFLLLGLFAAYVAHIRPFSITGNPTWKTWCFALAAFAMLFLILVRLPKAWPIWTAWFIRAIGWAGAAALMWAVRMPGGKRFDVHNYDIIILILANVVLGVSLVWALTRFNTVMRLGWLGVLMAIRLSTAAGSNWLSTAWNWSPETWLYQHHLWFTAQPWLFHAGFMSLLFIAIPGTIAGDLLLTWMRAEDGHGPRWKPARWWSIATLSFGLTPVLLWGLFTRHVWETFLVSAAVCAALRWLSARPNDATERLVRDVAAWGAFWLLLGLLFEPYEGGIKKDSATMSYYFVSSGLACFVLIAFTAVMDALRKPAALRLLADNGQNPMIAYVGLSNLVQPLLFLTGINLLVNQWTAGNADRQFAHGAVATLILALVVSAFSRRGIHWRT